MRPHRVPCRGFACLSDNAVDFGQEIGTNISTLVVAVAGFYFGSRSVSEVRPVDTDAAFDRRLERLATMKASDQLSDDEFAQAKNLLLGSS